MSIPTYDQFIDPVLRYLASHVAGAAARDVHEAAATAMGLTDEERQMLLPSGAQLIYKNRIGWAHDRLKRAGLSANTRRGFWQLTSVGLKFVQDNPSPLSAEKIEALASDFKLARLRGQTPETDNNHAPTIDKSTSPDERLENALAELHNAVVSELLDTLARVSPAYFETVVLDLLHRMGYGTSRTDLQRVGGSGDGGIDGIISLDKLGLEKVYVQAKRWQNSVGRPEVQAFYGALAGQRANKGVFITTSAFTPQAADFAKSVEKIVLVDGQRLARLMIEYEVGVTSRLLKVPKLDGDYFDE
ncbi:MAG: restriction endonuclease [Anaerolineae bacterium]|nr:restriction endonuclease [Anaerolineae bacterium]